MPRSRSSSILSSSCGRCLRGSTAPVVSRMRSASVDLPWSMCAMIEKLRMFRAGVVIASAKMLRAPQPAHHQLADLAGLVDAHREGHRGVDGEAREDDGAQADDLRHQGAAKRLV